MTLPSAADCAELYDRYHTPANVQAHLQVVANLAVQLAQARFNHGDPIDVGLVEAAARLHDLVRIAEQWVYLPASITTPLPHAEINYRLLVERWPAVADIIRQHSLMQIMQPQPFSSLAAKIVYYADKRVNHDQIVSLSDRLALGQPRWGVTTQTDCTVELLEKLTALEQDLFAGLALHPHDLTSNHTATTSSGPSAPSST